MDVWLSIEVDTGNGPKEIDVWYSYISDNLIKMAHLANLYQTIFEPKWSKAKSQIKPLEAGLNQLLMPEMKDEYMKLEGRHSFGTHRDFVRFAKEYLEKCKDHPKCKVNIGDMK